MENLHYVHEGTINLSTGIFYELIEHYIGANHLFVSFYILNLIFGIVAYKLGFAKKLPILKSVVVYILLLVGVFVLSIFSMFGMPITESLIVISLVLAIYRFRLYRERKIRKE